VATAKLPELLLGFFFPFSFLADEWPFLFSEQLFFPSLGFPVQSIRTNNPAGEFHRGLQCPTVAPAKKEPAKLIDRFFENKCPNTLFNDYSPSTVSKLIVDMKRRTWKSVAGKGAAWASRFLFAYSENQPAVLATR